MKLLSLERRPKVGDCKRWLKQSGCARRESCSFNHVFPIKKGEGTEERKGKGKGKRKGHQTKKFLQEQAHQNDGANRTFQIQEGSMPIFVCDNWHPPVRPLQYGTSMQVKRDKCVPLHTHIFGVKTSQSGKGTIVLMPEAEQMVLVSTGRWFCKYDSI